MLEPLLSLSTDQEVALEDLEDQLEALEEAQDLVVALMREHLTLELEAVVPVILRKTFPEYQEMTTQFMLRSQTPASSVMDKLKVDTMLIQRLSAKSSTSVAVMVMEALPNTASCVLMVPCLTSNILSVTGGSMLTAPWLSSSMLSMTRLQLKEMQTPQLELLEVMIVELEQEQELELELGLEEDQGPVVEELEAEEEDPRPQPPLQEDPTLLQTTMAQALLALETQALTLLILDMEHQQEVTLEAQLEALSVDMEAEGEMPETLTCLMLLSYQLKTMKNMSTRTC